MQRVRVIKGGTWNVEMVESELGETPLTVAAVLSPVITVDGFVEADSTEWLALVHGRKAGPRTTKTAESYARSLCGYASFLIERNTSLRGATSVLFKAYVNYRTVDPSTRVAGTTWVRDRTAIKQFHEWLRETYGVAMPFTVEFFRTPYGVVSSMREGRNVIKASAAGTPLEPPQIPELLAAAWRQGPDGAASQTNITGARDAAFIALGLACGARANTLAHLTIYELPSASAPGDLVEMILPGAISKTGRQVRMLAFNRHLAPLHAYVRRIGGSRNFFLKGWLPADPIFIKTEPLEGANGITDVDGIERPFNTMTANERRRLITPDGEPAMLFLSASNGGPLGYSAAEELTGDISRIAEVNAASRGGYFPHVHTHDLRHTYATHLAALFLLGIPTGSGQDMHGRPVRVDVRSAVKMACVGLGHASEASTSLYIQQVGLMALRYSISDFLGRADDSSWT